MAVNDDIIEALAQMQATQTALENALSALVGHNTDLEAHPDIRQTLRELLSSPMVVTEDKVTVMINKAMEQHEAKPYNEAHPGTDDKMEQFTNALAEFSERLAVLEARVQGREDAAQQTDLQRKLQQIEDKWATVLASLMQSYAEAEAQGSTAVMQEVQEAIAQALDDKKAELLAALDEHTAG